MFSFSAAEESMESGAPSSALEKNWIEFFSAAEENVESDALPPPTAVDKLDAMIGKAESAEMRMAAQTKRMRQLLNK